jgi:hypothetical protein
MLDFLCDSHEVDFQLLIEGCGDTLKHSQRAALVVGIFELGDNELLGAHEFSELPRGESDPGSGIIIIRATRALMVSSSIHSLSSGSSPVIRSIIVRAFFVLAIADVFLVGMPMVKTSQVLSEASLSLKHRLDITSPVKHPSHLNPVRHGAIEYSTVPHGKALQIWDKFRANAPQERLSS